MSAKVKKYKSFFTFNIKEDTLEKAIETSVNEALHILYDPETITEDMEQVSSVDAMEMKRLMPEMVNRIIFKMDHHDAVYKRAVLDELLMEDGLIFIRVKLFGEKRDDKKHKLLNKVYSAIMDGIDYKQTKTSHQFKFKIDF